MFPHRVKIENVNWTRWSLLSIRCFEEGPWLFAIMWL
jgi:hypothetical protein